jgi:hypothetical protein
MDTERMPRVWEGAKRKTVPKSDISGILFKRREDNILVPMDI